MVIKRQEIEGLGLRGDVLLTEGLVEVVLVDGDGRHGGGSAVCSSQSGAPRVLVVLVVVVVVVVQKCLSDAGQDATGKSVVGV